MILAQIHRIKNFLIDSLYPPFCRSCETVTQGEIFCGDCIVYLPHLATVSISLSSTIPLKIYAASDYVGSLRSLIMRKHYGDYQAAVDLGDFITSRLDLSLVQVDYIVPIPLHWTRLMSRGYNQVDVIAAHIAQKINKPVLKALKRSRATAYQLKLDRDERFVNLKDAFSLSLAGEKVSFEGKHIMLIDDLCTTGATLRETARVFLAHKPASIKAVVACRVVGQKLLG